MDIERLRETLQGRWLHSYEEDTEGEVVYRRASYPLPRSRGRTGFELLSGNGLVELGTAPADGLRETQGTWALGGGDVLELSLMPAGAQKRVLHVVSAEQDRLVVRE